MELVDFTVAGVAPVAPLVAFDRLVQHDPSTVFQGYLGLLPGVTAISHQSGPWNHPGERRTVHLTDGSQFDEEITRFVRPETPDVYGQFDYRATEYTKRLGHLVSDARVSWRYEPLGAATRIRLTYGFRPLPGRRIVVTSVIGPIWVRYMRRVMAECVTLAAGS